jgi:hypothetical protein
LILFQDDPIKRNPWNPIANNLFAQEEQTAIKKAQDSVMI